MTFQMYISKDCRLATYTVDVANKIKKSNKQFEMLGKLGIICHAGLHRISLWGRIIHRKGF